MKKILKVLIILFLAFFIFSVVSYLICENYLEAKLEEAIAQGYPGTEKVDVQLEVSFPWQALRGYIDYCQLRVTNWEQKNWQIDWFEGEFKGVKINIRHLIMKRILVIENIERGIMSLTLSETNLQRGLKNYYQDVDLNIVGDKLVLTLKVTIFGRELNAQVGGNLAVHKGGLVFAPQDLKVAGLNLPNYLEEQMLKKLQIPIPLIELPFSFSLTTVNILQGKIIITGKV